MVSREGGNWMQFLPQKKHLFFLKSDGRRDATIYRTTVYRILSNDYECFKSTHTNGTNFINGIRKVFLMHISVTFIYLRYTVANYLKLQVVSTCSKVADYKMSVFRWRPHEAVLLGCGYTAFTFEVILTTSVSEVSLGFSHRHSNLSKPLWFAFLTLNRYHF